MSDYSTIKNASILIPTSTVDIGTTTNPVSNIVMSGNLNLGNTVVTADNVLTPKISSLSYPNAATAASTTGSETITINGSGYQAGLGVYIANTIVPVSTVVNSSTITFTSPAKAAGSYPLVVINPDGGTGSFIPGISYSQLPTWSTAAGSIANVYEYDSIGANLSANSDSNVTFSISSGTLPSGVTLNSSTGNISGTAPAIFSGSTTYNFSVSAEDVELQDVARSFSITVSADAVTWNSPSGNSNITANVNEAYTLNLNAVSSAGRAITYSALALPTGLSVSGNTITGTPTTTGNSSAVVTATAATTGKTASVQLNYSVVSTKIIASGGTETTDGNFKIHTFTGSGTFSITNAPSGTTFEALIVAGGGAGSYAYAGGGGAGGVLYGTLNAVVGSIPVTVGGGGTAPTTSNTFITSGSNSSIVFNSTTYTAFGGGHGGGWWFERASGGSGGGAGGVAGVGASDGGPKTQTTQGPLTGYGNRGGGANRSSGQPGGGGGGAGAVGTFGGAGGAGIANPILGSTIGQLSSGTYYIAGGGGGAFSAGGLGGGGRGGNPPNKTAGSANTGGGGGGGLDTAGGAAGGSGVVIFRYQYQ
jgi:hypothetical protein